MKTNDISTPKTLLVLAMRALLDGRVTESGQLFVSAMSIPGAAELIEAVEHLDVELCDGPAAEQAGCSTFATIAAAIADEMKSESASLEEDFADEDEDKLVSAVPGAPVNLRV